MVRPDLLSMDATAQPSHSQHDCVAIHPLDVLHLFFLKKIIGCREIRGGRSLPYEEKLPLVTFCSWNQLPKKAS